MFDQQQERERLRPQSKRESTTRRQRESIKDRQNSRMPHNIKRLLFVICALIVLIIYQTYQNSVLSQKLRLYEMQTALEKKMWSQTLLSQDFTFHYQQQSTKFSILVRPFQVKPFEYFLEQIIKPYQHTTCKLRRYGSKANGGYLLCQNLLQQAQILLNFGVVDGDSFGCSLALQTNLENHQMICDNQEAHQIKCSSSEKVILETACIYFGKDISKTSHGIQPIKQIIQRKNIQGKHTILKLVAEDNQLQALSQVPPQLLESIDQMILTFNFAGNESMKWNYLQTLKSLMARFVPVNLHMNNMKCHNGPQPTHYLPSESMQVTLVKKDLISLISSERSFRTHRLNAPNDPSLPDCQIKQ